jgi:hypothetical protein
MARQLCACFDLLQYHIITPHLLFCFPYKVRFASLAAGKDHSNRAISGESRVEMSVSQFQNSGAATQNPSPRGTMASSDCLMGGNENAGELGNAGLLFGWSRWF